MDVVPELHHNYFRLITRKTIAPLVLQGMSTCMDEMQGLYECILDLQALFPSRVKDHPITGESLEIEASVKSLSVYTLKIALAYSCLNNCRSWTMTIVGIAVDHSINRHSNYHYSIIYLSIKVLDYSLGILYQTHTLIVVYSIT